jgi:hypothetical protein
MEKWKEVLEDGKKTFFSFGRMEMNFYIFCD